ncbi:MAG TPA: hypothetical protein VFE35_05155 [Candidatus Cybelea sp.]|jgi:hypothetical protein|nr:hypothetical protein [Candidatus Cybelea sp.]
MCTSRGGGGYQVLNGPTGTHDLTILTTEHLTLQTARQLCLQDMQGRSTMFLTIVSASLIAIGFFGTATHFGGGFVVFVLALLTSLWVLGFFTFVRILQAAVEDVIISFGIARIRHRYTEIAPNLRDSLVRSIHDDFRGINAEMGSEQSWWQRLMPTYVVISFVTSVVSGAVVTFALSEIFRVTPLVQAAAAIATFTINVIGFRIIAGRLWSSVDRGFPARYPSDSA